MRSARLGQTSADLRSRRGSVSPLRLLVLAWAVGLAVNVSGGITTWQHGNSPFRAEFDVVSQPSAAEAGTAVAVPVCGLGYWDGQDLYAFNELDQPLPLLAMGEGAENKALAVVKAPAGSKKIFVYFGSQVPAPQNRMGILPGLTVDVRSYLPGPFNNWADVEKLMQRSLRRGKVWVDKIQLSYNPVTSEAAILMVFEGYLRVPQAGSQTLMLVSQDAGYLFVDNKLVIERNGRQSAHNATRGQSRATLNLTAGTHAIKCVVVGGGGEVMALVGRWINERSKAALGPQDFLQSGQTRLANVSAHFPQDPCPVFYCRPESYIGYGGFQFTEVSCGISANQPADWFFGDGARYHGAELKKVFVGLSTVDVTVRQKKVEARGRVEFPALPPKARSIGNHADFKHFSTLILQENHERIDLSTLKGYRVFLGFQQRNSDLVPVCNAILKKAGLDDGTLREVALDLARVASVKDPDRSAQLYRQLFRMREDEGKKPWWRDMAREYAEFAIFRVRDLGLAQSVADTLGKLGSVEARAAAASLELDICLHRNELDKARLVLDRMLRVANEAGNQRLAVVKTNALRERYGDLLDGGFINEAYPLLWEWEALAPEDRMNGTFPLERSRLWKTFGWLDAALAELDAAMRLNTLLPNLPEVEYERGRLFEAAGEGTKAQEVFQRIAEHYPNHPLAADARKRLK